MTVFDAIKDRVTAREAAEVYGLHFGRNKRACCPWHNDSHPDLAFYDNGKCYCFTCHNGGDSIALTAQIFGLTMLDAAKKINADFDLGLDVSKPISKEERNIIEQRRIERERAARQERREWDLLCRVRHIAADQIEKIMKVVDRDKWDKCWDNPQFVRALSYRARADDDLERIWAAGTVIHYDR